MPEGYSSLGGQVLLPSDTDKTPAGSSAGSAAATRRGPRGAHGRHGDLDRHGAADRARRASPASSASSRRSGWSAATASCRSPSRRTRPARSPARSPTPRPSCRRSPAPTRRTRRPRALRRPNYLTGLVPTALQRQADRRDQQHDGAVPDRRRRAPGRGAATTVVTVGTPSPNPASIVTREFKRDLNAYLGGTTGTRREVAAGDHRLQHREPGRGPEVPAGPAARRAGDRPRRSGHGAAYDVGQDRGARVEPRGDRRDPDQRHAPTRATTRRDRRAERQRARRHRRPRRLPGADRPGRLRHGRRRPQPDRRHVRRHGLQRGEAARRRGYAYEQATNVRLAPSFTNPSMWRCVPGSTFFTRRAVPPGRPADHADVHPRRHDRPADGRGGRNDLPPQRRPDHGPASP